MSKKDMSREPQTLTEVRVEGRGEGRGEERGRKVPSRRNEFVYVNSAFVGSVTSVNASSENRTPGPVQPITGVYREQYWACSRWPYTQRLLAITVGVLLGALIGLIISMVMNDGSDSSVISPIFKMNSKVD